MSSPKISDPAACSLPSLAEITPRDRPRVGGKALHLATMVKGGLPVPPGFVVPTDVLAAALAKSGLVERAAAFADDPSPGAAKALHDALATLTMPPGVEAALVAAARALGGRVAVRSSAVDEDGRSRSFAGQHTTSLHCAPEAVPDAVRACWASLVAPEAIAYRKGRGPPLAGMAVVVQRMVEPRASGVMFTINPLNGSWREMIVEATWGLGEGLVSGRVTPHWYLVRRPRRTPGIIQRVLSRVRLHVVQQDLPEIPERWAPRPDGTVGPEPVPLALRGRATLDRSALLRLCRMGLRVEQLMGEPQDVEWAIDANGELHMLQARPITTAGSPRTRTDVLWTRRFIGERWPDAATPLGWSLVAPILEWFIAYPETQLRHLGGGPPLRLVNSRPYLNATVFRHLAFKLPGAPALQFPLELMPAEEQQDWQRRHAVLPGFGVYASILRETANEKRWERFRWNPFTNHLRWDEFRARLEAELPALSRAPASEGDAVRLVQAQVAMLRDYVGVHVTSLLFANLWDQVLDGLLSVWLPDDGPALHERLATCPPGNLTLATNAALWSLAHRATDEDLAALSEGLVPAGAFGTALQAFLAEYGHRSTASWEVFSPRWADHPAMLVPLLKLQRAAPEPLRRADDAELAFQAAKDEATRLVRGPRRRMLLRVVELNRAYLLLRENQRFWFDRLLQAMQRTMLDLGQRFADRGIVDQADDVAFLTWDEVRGLVDGTLPGGQVRDWVARRRAQREADLKVEPPVFFRGDVGIADEAVGTRLQGLGISPGRARGRVRILASPADGPRLQPGDVLVTHAVDPGWTPLFVNAAAIVLEMGSRLSHGAVVAREYKIPAVVNIGGVTRRLQDGQEVTVDGTRGIVWVH
jgi:phosphohistidine swiveling domain-containing protein